MPIRIKEINVQNLGPINTIFKMRPGIFNLIYGRNETGKTYLVEFIIRSLFKNIREWKLRDKQGKGNIVIEGLNGKEISFSLSRSPKIDELWNDESIGVSSNFSKLLIVKGAELDFSDDPKINDKAIIKRYLSDQPIIEQIDARILPTIQKATVTKGAISKVGTAKIFDDREKIEKIRKQIDDLFEEINQDPSHVRVAILTEKKEQKEQQLEKLKIAKRFKAFRLAQEINKLEKKKSDIDEKELSGAKDKNNLYKNKLDEVKGKKEFQKKLAEKSIHLEWLEKAKINYETYIEDVKIKTKFIYLILSLVLILSLPFFYLLKIFYATLASSIASAVFLYLHHKHMKKLIRQAPKNEQIQAITSKFKNLLGIELTDYATLQEQLDKLKESRNEADILMKQIFKEEGDLRSLREKTDNHIFNLTGEHYEPNKWDSIIHKIEKDLSEINTKKGEYDTQLKLLKVPATEYIKDNPNLEFDKDEYEKLETRLAEINKQIAEENQKSRLLKQKICGHTGDDITIDRERLIQNLRDKRKKLNTEYKELTAEIVGKKAVHSVLEDLRKDEDRKLLDGLQSKNILKIISKINRSINNLYLEDNKLIVSYDDDDFSLANLSTGTREQILLALRIGFAQRLTKQDEPLFLILDDAFQYSDWERRVWLMNAIVELAKAGWQIIYFTMDDHIRDLFKERGEINFKNDFRYEELR